MSNRLFQGVIHQMRDTIDRTIGVIDETSVVIACSELGKIGEVNEHITSEMLTSAAPIVLNGYTYKSFLLQAMITLLRNMPLYLQFLLAASSSIMTRNMIEAISLKM